MLRLARTLRLQSLVRIGRPTYPFCDYFKGLEKAEAVRRIFGERTKEVLHNLRVEFVPIGGYMWIDSTDGHLVISSSYMKRGNRADIYLDLIHKLVHVKQFLEGKDLFDTHISMLKDLLK